MSLLVLLQAIETTQPPAGEQEPKSTLRRLKEAVGVARPDTNITWICITDTRTEAIKQGFVNLDNYIHTLTDAGKEKLANLRVENGCQKEEKAMALA